MNMLIALIFAATVSLDAVKLGTAPGKTMVVTGVTVDVSADIYSATNSLASTNFVKTAISAATNGFVRVESDPVWNMQKSAYETSAHAADTYQPKGNYITIERDPVWASEKVNYLTRVMGDYLYQPKGSYVTTEVDPIWNAEKIFYETITNADAKFQRKGNYIVTETDPTVGLTNNTVYASGTSRTFVTPGQLGAYATYQWVQEQGYISQESDPHSSIENGTITIHGESITPIETEVDPTVGLTNGTVYIHGETIRPTTMEDIAYCVKSNDAGNVSISGHVDVGGNIAVSGGLDVNGGASIGGTLSAVNLDLSGDAGVGGSVTASKFSVLYSSGMGYATAGFTGDAMDYEGGTAVYYFPWSNQYDDDPAHSFAIRSQIPNVNGLINSSTATNIAEYVVSTNGFETASHAANTYQVKGNYLTSESDPVWTSDKPNYLTTSTASSTYYTKTQTDQKVSDAISTASGDATAKANAAQSSAISAAASDATSKANSARADSFAFTTAVSNKFENGKQNTIADLTSIRAGASAGSTAVQPAAISDMATKTWVGGQGYLTSVAWNEVNNKPSWIGSSKPTYSAAEVGADASGTASSAVSTHNSSANSHATLFEAKQDTISDLATIRSGAAAGATAVQSLAPAIGYTTDVSNKLETANAATRAIVQTWEGFLDGSNVVFSITNYISGSYSLDAAKFRILEMTNGVYREVYNSRDEIELHLAAFETNTVDAKISTVMGVVNGKADKAWGQYTSAGTPVQDIGYSNTVYLTAPETYFAGGLEFERVAVGEGMVSVLCTKGAPVYTQGEEGTFKFQSDGGTNYFGFARTDSYVLGADAESIRVANRIVTITYDVTSGVYPCLWYIQTLQNYSEENWEQLNTSDGQPIAGASHVVQWEQNPPEGKRICYVNCQEASGFFKATIEVPGSAKFVTNMPADLGAGIICTNTATGVNGVIRPTFNGSTVTWQWSGL